MDFRTRNLPQLVLFGLFFSFSFALSGCQPDSPPSNPSYSQKPESSYCGGPNATNYTGATATVSGTATFQYRALVTVGICTGLCGDPVSLGIPYAEVHIVDGDNKIIQCGETNATGAFSLVIPQTAGTYKVQVLSRSSTNKVKASVLKDIYSASPYTVESSFSLAEGQSSASGVSVVASARLSEDPDLPGAAFNILADVFWANEFLRTSLSDTGFVANKVTVFWQAGFNPYSYFSAPTVLASFYVASENRLYILGGANGDVKSSDTDHFDDSVILHEYGHFLEAQYGRGNSPGGSHNGDFIIDPRLAWSEGWSNYFQAAVQNSIIYNSSYSGPRKGTGGFTRYIDTVGFANDSTEGSGTPHGIQINRSLSETNATATLDHAGPNEGIFREFSISRTLFKSTTNSGGLPFKPLWDTFTEVRNTGSPAYKFMNFGLFNLVLQNILNTNYVSQDQTTWNNIITEENQKKSRVLYGNYLGTQAPSGNPLCPTTALSPVVDAKYTYDRSNQLMSNDFYTYYHDGSSKKIGLKSTSTGDIVDMNLYLYSEDYYYSEEYSEAQAGFSNSTMVRKSKTYNISSSSETEVIDLTGLAAGYYMINVKASTFNKKSADLTGTSNYYLYIGDSTTVSTCLVPN